MKNTFGKLVLASAVAAIAALSSTSAIAASEPAATVNVPFSFTVHGRTLPAGVYRVAWDPSGNLITLRNKAAVESFLWNPGSSKAADGRLVMRFEQHGRECALESIRYGDVSTPRLTTRDSRRGEATPISIAVGQ